MMNPNTKKYWDDRFASGDWEANGGRNQTRLFAKEQVSRLGIPDDFSGRLLDFGCGLGDAIPVYQSVFPNAQLFGLDHSDAAIESCRKNYGHLATFIRGDVFQVPSVDIIIASNVLEHLENDLSIAGHLLDRCTSLFVAVPFNEKVIPGGEHLRTYDEHHFDLLGNVQYEIYRSIAWGHSAIGECYHVHFKNIGRLLLGRALRSPARQILFRVSRS